METRKSKDELTTGELSAVIRYHEGSLLHQRHLMEPATAILEENNVLALKELRNYRGMAGVVKEFVGGKDVTRL